MFCQKCGAQSAPGENFCRFCGHLIDSGNISSQPINSIQSNVSNVKKNNPTVKPNPQYVNQSVNTVKAKKPINKKILISVIISAIIIIATATVGVLALISYIKEAPSREMEKALESKDINQVIDVFNEHDIEDISLLTKPIVKYINSATDTFNNNFELNPGIECDEGEIHREMINFMSERFGSVLYLDGSKSPLWNLEDYVKYYYEEPRYGGTDASGNEFMSDNIESALKKLNNIINSKEAYYYGLSLLNNPYDSEDYCEAIEKFNQVIAVDSKYNDAVAKSSEAFDLYFKGTMEAVDKYIASGDYSAAVQLLNDTVDGVSDSKEYSEAIATKADEILKTYASQYAQKAEEYFRAGDVNAAIGNIEAAISIDCNGGYEANLNEYKLYLPLALYDINNVLSRSSDYRIQKESSLNSVNNKEYNNCLLYRHYQDCSPSTISYLLEGKYDTVSGIYFSPKENASMNRTGTAYFEVYGDGKLIYTSPTISAESLPTEVEFSVIGVQKLEIKFIGKGSSVWGVDAQWYGDYAALSDLTARKNIPQ